MKKILGTALAAGAALAGGAAMAGSADAAVAYNVGIASDYVFRGLDQFGAVESTAEAFGGVDWTSSASHFYAGAWVSNTGTLGAGSRNVEVDVYGGWKPVVGPVTLDLGAIGYLYTDTPGIAGPAGNTSKASNYELKAAASIPFGPATFGAKVYWSPNFGGDYNGFNDDDSFYYEANAAYAFKNKATLSGALGVVDVPDYKANFGATTNTYVTANVGVTYPIMDHLSIDGRVYQNNADANQFLPGAEGTKFVGTLTATF